MKPTAQEILSRPVGSKYSPGDPVYLPIAERRRPKWGVFVRYLPGSGADRAVDLRVDAEVVRAYESFIVPDVGQYDAEDHLPPAR